MAEQRSARRLSFGRVLFYALVLLVVALVVIVGRTGLVPGVSTIVGAASPRNLGVTATPADFASAVQRLGYRLDNMPAATDPAAVKKVYSGQMKVDQDLSQSELSALLTYNHVSWWPLQDVQVKVHQDGTLETSAGIITENIPTGAIPEGILRSLPTVLPDLVPIYVKARLDVVNPTELKLTIHRLELGRTALPESVLTDENRRLANDFINDRLRSIPGFTIETLSFADGKVHFKGTFPQEFKRVPVKP